MEVMVAVSIISIAFLAAVSTFNTVTNAIQSTKNRTLATNLAQEQIQILRQISYNRIMVTPVTNYRTEFSSPVPYDVAYYPPANVLEGGVLYERLTYVQMASEVGGELKYFGSTPDTGMKAVTISVIWTQRNEKKLLQIKSVIANPDAIKVSAAIKGRVTVSGSGAPISGANVVITENVAWRSATDSSGDYLIRVYDGKYKVNAGASGFFSATREVTVAANQTATVDFPLVAMASGTVRGFAWLNDGPVISQVVGSTINTTTGFDQEYVELFNPTPNAWPMASNPTTPVTGLKYVSTSDEILKNISIDYATLSIPPSGYYLMANTTTVIIGGEPKNADAVWSATNADFPNIIKCAADGASHGGGGVGIYKVSDNSWLDIMGWDWNGGSKSAPIYETDGYDQNTGLQRGEQFVRKSSTSGVVAGQGRCYDSHNNNKDVTERNPVTFYPLNSSNTELILAGKPAIGAMISSPDGLSYSVTAAQIGSPPAAEFVLTSVATGQWSIMLTSGTFSRTISSVTVATNGETVMIPSAATSPPWPLTNYYSAFINQTADVGYISGRVTNAYNAPISAPSPIKVRVGPTEVAANPSTGRYIMAVSSGVYTVEANPNSDNSYYVYQTKDAVTVSLGVVTSGVNFVLSQGGLVSGWVTRDGINPLPNVSVIALDSDEAVLGVGISEQDGRFTILNLSTGTYTIKPELDAKETSIPDEISANVTLGANIFIGTFTVTDAFGKIRGSVRSGGQSISTGVMLVASTTTISTGNPPALVPDMLQIYYMANSYEDGTYILEVRGGSALYSVAAFYPTLSQGAVSVSTKTLSNIAVSPGASTTGVNFDW